MAAHPTNPSVDDAAITEDQPLSTGPLAGTVVVDCAERVAGAYASWLLAALGARVIKVEPPGGDRLRALGPFPDDRPHPELGGLHLALNAGKESLLLDLDAADGQARLRTLVAGADILLESAGPGVMSARGLGADKLLTLRPALVYASHSPFGQNGPYACRATSEIVDYAMGGYMYFSGHPDKAPLLVPGFQGEFHAGMQLAAGATIALWHARQTGAGQQVDVSTFESMLNAHSWLTTWWSHEGDVQTRLPSPIIPCADGYVFWFGVGSTDLFVLIARPDLMDDPRWQTLEGWRQAQQELRSLFAQWAAGRTKLEIYHAAQALRLAVTPVNDVDDIAHSEQLAARSWWRTVDHPLAGSLELPGVPWKFSDTVATVRGAAPLMDSYAGPDPAAPPAAAPHSERADAQPLAGVRVLEVTANWAGPLAGRHLADMGADVIKVEVARRPATRGGHPAGGEQWVHPYNRSGYFNLFNRNKRDLVVDLATPQGREIFLRLVERSDVVLENNSARVFANFGLEFETLSARNPQIIMCSMSGFGGSGPEMHYVAYGANIEASCGLVAHTGYGDGDLFGTGSFYADPIAGTHGALAIVAALTARERTGRGQHIDMSLQESGILFNTEAMMDFRLSGRVAGPRNNRSGVIAPQGVYRSAGQDCWLAVGVESDEQWAALCDVIGHPELATRHQTVQARQAAHDSIDAAIEAWSQERDHNHATQLLQAAGIPGGPVLANWEIVSDPHLFERGYFIDIVHPEVGHHRWDGWPWHLSRTPGRVRSHAPLFAEHNDEVLRKVLGLSEPEIAELRATRVIADEPEIRRFRG